MATRTVLFVCVENAGRSLMAEAMFNGNPPVGWEAVSAGTQPAPAPHPRTATVLREIGLELPGHSPRLLTNELIARSSVIVTMGCLDSESCPAKLRAVEVRDWALPDPSALDDAGFRKVCQTLQERVEGLRRELALSERRRAALPKGR